MDKTENIGLHLTPTSEREMKFLQWRQMMNGDQDDSNMQKIDRAIGNLNERTPILQGGENPVNLLTEQDIDPTLTQEGKAADAAAVGERIGKLTGSDENTAKNSDKLGGKAPEQYLPAVNLLDNTDFEIAHEGYGSLHGTTRYAADRWPFIGTINSINVNRGVMTIAAKNAWERMDQVVPIERLKTGVYTFAIKIRNGALEPRVYINGAQAAGRSYGAQSEWVTAVVNFAIDNITAVTSFAIRLYFTNTNTVEICEPVLYSGTYTADTLPPYVPKGYASELLACKVADTGGIDADTIGGKPPEYYLPAVNLLANSDWRENHFIAQAGINGTLGGTSYLGDRWINEGNITAILTNSGTQLISNDQYSFIHQYISKLTIGTTYTVAIRRSGTGYSRLAVFDTKLSTTYASDIGYKDLLILNFTATTEDVRILVYPSYTNDGGAATFWEPVLYKGTYTADTLPPFVPPAPAVELLRCQQYCVPLKMNAAYLIGMGGNSTGDNARLFLPLPIQMIKAPTINAFECSVITPNGTSSSLTYTPTNVSATPNGLFIHGKFSSRPSSELTYQTVIVTIQEDIVLSVDP